MEIWQEIIKNRERGARELVAVYQDRLFASALILCRDRRAAEELVFRTFARAIDKISSFRPISLSGKDADAGNVHPAMASDGQPLTSRSGNRSCAGRSRRTAPAPPLRVQPRRQA